MSTCSVSSRNSFRNPGSVFPMLAKAGRIHHLKSNKLSHSIGWLDDQSVKADNYTNDIEVNSLKVESNTESHKSRCSKPDLFSGRIELDPVPSQPNLGIKKLPKRFAKLDRHVVKTKEQSVKLTKITNNISTDRIGLPPSDLLKRFTLPVAAYFCSLDAPPGVDVSQPFLLYKNYSSTKVRASSLQINKENTEILTVGPTLVIPDTYSGWFSLVTDNGRVAPSYSSIEDLAKAQPMYFLTRFQVPAYVSETSSGDTPTDRPKITYRRVMIQSGQVLKLLGVFEDQSNKKISPEKRQFRNANYIQCLSHKNEALYIPFSATGRFYETAPRNCSDSNHIYLLSQILSTFQLPITVRLVCGYMSRIPEGFTGLLRLEKIEKESVVLACTMTPEANATLFEMDATSTFHLSPVMDPLFSKSPIYLKTVSFCSDEADTWQRQVKILHNVMQERKKPSFGRTKPNKTSRSNSLNLSIPFVSSLNKARGRTKERRRTTSVENSNGASASHHDVLGFRESSSSVTRDQKESRTRESRLRHRVFDKIQDFSRNRHSVANNEFVSIRMIDKLTGEKKVDDLRKISKQNTYVLQNEKASKKNNKKFFKAEKKVPSTVPIENENYATVVDDITDIMHDLGIKTSDSLYSEICSRDFTLESIPVVTN